MAIGCPRAVCRFAAADRSIMPLPWARASAATAAYLSGLNRPIGTRSRTTEPSPRQYRRSARGAPAKDLAVRSCGASQFGEEQSVGAMTKPARCRRNQTRGRATRQAACGLASCIKSTKSIRPPAWPSKHQVRTGGPAQRPPDCAKAARNESSVAAISAHRESHGAIMPVAQ